MPNIASKKKNVRKIAKATVANRSIKARIHTAARQVETAIEENKGDTAVLQKLLSFYFKVVDKAAQRNVIKKNTAARRKSYFSRKAFPNPNPSDSKKPVSE